VTGECQTNKGEALDHVSPRLYTVNDKPTPPSALLPMLIMNPTVLPRSFHKLLPVCYSTAPARWSSNSPVPGQPLLLHHISQKVCYQQWLSYS
jgi:hypothetical protein